MEPAHFQPLNALSEQAGCLYHEIVVPTSGERSRRAFDMERQGGVGLEPEIVACAGKGHEALQIMIAVVPASEHMEGEVDLGGSACDERLRHGASMPESGADGKGCQLRPLSFRGERSESLESLNTTLQEGTISVASPASSADRESGLRCATPE
jgi:hypothetical protein